MKKGILICSICMIVLMVSLPAMSYAWDHGRGRHYGHGHYYGRGWDAAGGFILGTVIGSAFARPVYVPPPPVYVVPPPPAAYYYPPPRPYRAYAYPY